MPLGELSQANRSDIELSTSIGGGGRKVISPEVVLRITTLTRRYLPDSPGGKSLSTVRTWISLSIFSERTRGDSRLVFSRESMYSMTAR
ncbi:MAG: hypothetical protein UY18_C0046G0008 [Microgenomates group bacterium GW2011_GWF2_47_9]|nr:MAG: hypothetical protein UY18_C0046G0008 [Microgenomates group bacterium GW2011_GWF2_47_9]